MQRIRRPAHLINALYFTTILIGALALALHYEITHAYIAPRLYTICEQNWIGSPYNIRLAHHPGCQQVWGQLTRETLLEESEYFAKL